MWAVRSPPPTDPEERKSLLAPSEPDLDALLSEGFLERTKERGMVVKSWAPQLAILNHESVGGFVTHCGWNSVLEAVCAGVLMVAWPLYAEQHLNRWFLVEEMMMALALQVEDESGFVTSLLYRITTPTETSPLALLFSSSLCSSTRCQRL